MTVRLPSGVARSVLLYSKLTSRLRSHAYARLLQTGLLIYLTSKQRLLETLRASDPKNAHAHEPRHEVRRITNEHLHKSLRILDEWISLYHAVGIAGLPATDKRAQDEEEDLFALRREGVEHSKRAVEQRRQRDSRLWVSGGV